MDEKPDRQLLHDYARHGDEAAFREIVARYTDLVYSAAARQVETPHTAADITQTVFVDLARKAATLSAGTWATTSLAGWLHRATRYLALNHRRDSHRRVALERQAMAQLLTDNESTANWEQIRPTLDEALDHLGEDDREVLLLRYFKNHDLRTVGATLGISDDAAQKRVSRAVERLREFFAKRGVTVGASGLAVVISANAVQAAPVGLALTISTAAALTGTTLATTATVTATKAIAMTALQKTIVTATIAVLAGAGIYEARQATQLREQVRTLLQQQAPLAEQIQQLQTERDSALKQLAGISQKPAPHLPAPPLQITQQTANSGADELSATNLYAKLKGTHRLSAADVAPYLKSNKRNAASLLAAYRTTRDASLLDEAIRNFPNDPQVAFEALLKPGNSPTEQRAALDAFKQTSPDNVLANYLSALNYFNAGHQDEAVRELVAADAKTQFQDFSIDRIQSNVEAFLTAGYSTAEAKAFGYSDLIISQYPYLKGLGQNMVSLANSYQQAGDESSARAVLQMVMRLGQNFGGGNPGESLIAQLTSISIQRMALTAMNSAEPYGNNQQTVQDYLNRLTQERETLQGLNRQVQQVLPMMSDLDWTIYADRFQVFGEQAAMQWAIDKYGQK